MAIQLNNRGYKIRMLRDSERRLRNLLQMYDEGLVTKQELEQTGDITLRWLRERLPHAKINIDFTMPRRAILEFVL